MSQLVEKLTLTRAEAARILSVSVSSLDREVARKRIAHLRVRGRVLFRPQMLEEYLQRISISAMEVKGWRKGHDPEK